MFENDIEQVLSESLEREQDCKRMTLTRAAEIVREDMFHNTDLFSGTFSQTCQQHKQRSVSPSLLTLVNMIPGGTNEQSHEQGNQQAALSIAQLLSIAQQIQQYKAWAEIY